MFSFNSRQRTGLLVFVFFVWIIFSIVYLKKQYEKNLSNAFKVDQNLITKLDSLKAVYDSLQSPRIFPFNPNFLSDYRAYILGIDTVALKKIRNFRAKNFYFTSADQFKEVSEISDSLFNKLKPYIRISSIDYKRKKFKTNSREKNFSATKNIMKKDLNKATREDLIKVYGIGNVLSSRIIKYRNKLGGFTIREQLKDVYGLSDEAYRNLWKYFDIKTPLIIDYKINLNNADMQELQSNPYIDFDLSEKIVDYRSLHGKFKKLEDLKKIPGFPVDKYKRIILYLQIK